MFWFRMREAMARTEMVASYGFMETGDVAQWTNWLDQASHSKCIYGLEVSMRAAILIQSLPTEPKICAAVAESPFSSFREIGIYRAASMVGSFLPLDRAFVATGFAYARLRYGIDFTHVSPEEAVTRTRTPLLLIHGGADTNIPIAQSRAILRRRPENTELWEIPTATHVGCYATAWFGSHQR